MGIWTRMSNIFDKKKEEPVKTNRYARMYKGGQFSNTTDLNLSLNSNADTYASLSTLRNRSRDIIQNNGYAKGIVTNLKNNIIGPSGVRVTIQGVGLNGKLDIAGNLAVQKAWDSFCEYGIADVEENKDIVKFEQMVLQSTVVDGEALILIHRGDEFGKHRIKFEIVSIDVLGDLYQRLPNGNIVFDGVEINQYSKVVAYWMRPYDMNDPSQRMLQNNTTNYTRIPATDVIHLYDTEYPKQLRGVPWLATSLLPLHHISQLISTELVQARMAANKRVMFKINPDETYVTDADYMDEAYNVNSQLDAASIEVLQPGMEPVSIEWQSPNTGLTEFTKTNLRQIAAGVGVSYNAIAKDLESVNYSSARFGALEDRATFQERQRWFGNAFVKRIYLEWLEVQLMYNTIALPSGASPFGIDKFEKFSEIKLTYKGFQSVDPKKDADAAKAQLGIMTTTFSDICSQTGQDFGEILDMRVQQELLIKDKYEKAGLAVPEYNSFIFGGITNEEAEIEEMKVTNQTQNTNQSKQKEKENV